MCENSGSMGQTTRAPPGLQENAARALGMHLPPTQAADSTPCSGTEASRRPMGHLGWVQLVVPAVALQLQ